MNDELHFTMERKHPPRQSPCGNKSNGVICDKKNDYISNKNGRQKKFRDSGNGGRSQDPIQQPPKPMQKYSRNFGDKRPRQRSYSDYRQSEEIAEPLGIDIDNLTSRKGKGNANYLLNFSFKDHGGYQRSYENRSVVGSWGSRKAYRQVPSYKKEQYLQSSLQFVVEEDGDYSEQAINPDALVDWETVQLVRTFNTQIVTCPICLDVPIAAKLTRCGHTFCWACILHYLQVNDNIKNEGKCPVCNDRMDADSLKSVQNVLVPEYKIGDEIEMRLMKKSKGSVFVCPEDECIRKTEMHLNVSAGELTKFSKLVTASWSQVQDLVIEREKDELARALVNAEPEEICFLQMAQHRLQDRESILKLKQKPASQLEVETKDLAQSKPIAASNESIVENSARSDLCKDSKIAIQYVDAFEEEEEETCEEGESVETGAEGLLDCDSASDPLDMSDIAKSLVGSECDPQDEVDADVQKQESSRLLIDSSVLDALSPDEAADHLELPESSGRKALHQQRNNRPKDTYHFYQASTGQHIYMNSVNARCFDMEYGGLENSPRTVKASVVAVERIFMTEETRKRLRYLNHIPLATEFHVVELKIKPPVISKNTLKHFQPEFDKRRKFRQKKAKEERIRANKHEIEHKKLHGVYVAPETVIPLDNAADFPSHLASSSEAIERQRRESTNSDVFPESGTNEIYDDHASSGLGSPPPGDTPGSSPSFASFAQKLQSSGSSTVWGAASSPPAWPQLSHSATMPEMRGGRLQVWGPRAQDESANDGGDDGGEAYQAPSMASAWLSSLHDLPREPQSSAHLDCKYEESGNTGGKKKKKKNKNSGQLLFSTAMTRKN